MLHNGHSFPAWILFLQVTDVTFAVNSIFKIARCVWVQRFFTNTYIPIPALRHMRKTCKLLFRNYWGSIGCWWTWARLSLIFIKVKWPQIVIKTTQTRCPDFFQKKVLSDDRSEIRLFSTGQSMRALKLINLGLASHTKYLKSYLKYCPWLFI